MLRLALYEPMAVGYIRCPVCAASCSTDWPRPKMSVRTGLQSTVCSAVKSMNWPGDWPSGNCRPKRGQFDPNSQLATKTIAQDCG